MASRPLRVLLVDDNPGDRDLACDRLEQAGGHFEVRTAACLREALEQLGQGPVDVMLLDLGLPDCQGIETLRQLQAPVPEIPIVILTGAEDDRMAHEALSAGAQDFLAKSWTDANLTARSLRYAVERKQLQLQLERERRSREAEREEAAHGSFAAIASSSVTARLFGQKSLREGSPTAFDENMREYAKSIRMALDNRITTSAHAVSERLCSIAERMGQHLAGPRDVVDIHRAAMAALCDGANGGQVEAYLTEGRLLLLELMGNLVNFYRSYYSGFRRLPRLGTSGSGERSDVQGAS